MRGRDLIRGSELIVSNRAGAGGRRYSTLSNSAGRMEMVAGEHVSSRPVAYWLFGMGGLVAGMVLVGTLCSAFDQCYMYIFGFSF